MNKRTIHRHLTTWCNFYFHPPPTPPLDSRFSHNFSSFSLFLFLMISTFIITGIFHHSVERSMISHPPTHAQAQPHTSFVHVCSGGSSVQGSPSNVKRPSRRHMQTHRHRDASLILVCYLLLLLLCCCCCCCCCILREQYRRRPAGRRRAGKISRWMCRRRTSSVEKGGPYTRRVEPSRRTRVKHSYWIVFFVPFSLFFLLLS